MVINIKFGLEIIINRKIKSMTRILVTVLGTAIFLANCQSSFAQQHEGHLNILWDEVQRSYPGLETREATVQAAQMEERFVFGERLPQLRLQAQNSYATYEGISGAFFPQPGLFNISGANGLTGPSWTFNTYASSTLEWELFSFGKYNYKSKAARAKTHSVQGEKDTYSLHLKKELSHRYLQLLLKETKLETNHHNLNRLNTVRSITSALSKAGLKSAADSLLATSSFNQALGDSEKLKGEKQAALIQLLELTNGKETNYLASVPRFLEPLNPPLNKTTEIDATHPILTSLEEQRKSLDYLAKSEASSALPSVNLIAGYAYRGVGIGNGGTVSDHWNDGFSNSVTNGLVGVGITWNISDLYTQKQRSGSLKKQAESEGHRYKQYEQEMQAELASIQYKLQRQYTEMEKTHEAQQQANAAYQMYLSRYKSGLMDLSNLLQIQILLEQAEKKHINAAFDFWMLMVAEAELTADFSHLFTNL